MTSRRILWSAMLLISVVGLAAAIRCGMAPRDAASASPGEAKTKASQVARPLKEDELNRVTLSEQAVQSLGIEIDRVARRQVARGRSYGGEAIIPPGRLAVVAAPVGGLLKAPPHGTPTVGSRVEQGQVIYQLLPLLTPEGRTTLETARVDARGQVESSATQLDAARVALDRAQRLLRQGAGSQRIVDESQAAHDVAAKTHDAANARLTLLTRAVEETSSGIAAPLPLESPRSGVLRSLTALADQIVPGGAPLFEVIDADVVWIRVAVPSSDLGRIATAAAAQVADLAARAGDPVREARPVAAPPSANALAATVDLHYEAHNRDGHFHPGERVAVTVALEGEDRELAVPWSAIVHDIYGGSWLYRPAGERSYARQRVLVRYVRGDAAVLSEGPPEGTPIVAVGAQELFGAETGFSK